MVVVWEVLVYRHMQGGRKGGFKEYYSTPRFFFFFFCDCANGMSI